MRAPPGARPRGPLDAQGPDRALLVSSLLAAVALTAAPAYAQSESRAVRDLRAEVEALGARVGRLEDVSAVENLQRAYGYYVDFSQFYDVADLFAQDSTLEIGGRGVFVGKPRVFAYLEQLGPTMAPVRDGMYFHQQLQPLVTLAPDGESAAARWAPLVMAGSVWGDVTYENRYVKDDGVWKIRALRAPFNMYTEYAQGWARQAEPNTRPESWLPPPDLPPSVGLSDVPELPRGALPFRESGHRPERAAAASRRRRGRAEARGRRLGGPAVRALARAASAGLAAVGAAGLGLPAAAQLNNWLDAGVRSDDPPELEARDPLRDLRAEVEALGARVERLEDIGAIERVQRAYGYYVDKNQYYDMTDLFTDDAIYEIGGRGVFVGKERVFEYASGLGPTMEPRRGIIFNHQQLQPIVTVAEDGETARARLQALVVAVAQWGDVTYENEYAKEDGVWKISRIFAPFNMYTDYDKGWAIHARPANRPESFGAPPDLPPSVVTLNYPNYYVAPFHYPNPVTGEPAPPPNPAAGGVADMSGFASDADE